LEIGADQSKDVVALLEKGRTWKDIEFFVICPDCRGLLRLGTGDDKWTF